LEGRPSDHQGGNKGGRNADGHGKPRAKAEVSLEDGDRIRTDAEEHSVAQRDLVCITSEQVPADGGRSKDAHQDEDPHLVLVA